MNVEDLPPVDRPLERLAEYQRAREEERERVEAALRKEPDERTEAERAVIAYSPLGSASRCGY